MVYHARIYSLTICTINYILHFHEIIIWFGMDKKEKKLSTNHIPVGVSNRHMHLTREAVEVLFGPGSELKVYRYLRQRGEFASEQYVEMTGPKGKFAFVRILGPLRDRIQIEVSRTDAFQLGIHPPVGKFSGLPEGESIAIKGPHGSLTITENIMISRRHIHINAEDAQAIGIKDQDSVYVAPVNIKGDPMESRLCVLGNVLVRVKDTFVKELHIDTDEANACGLIAGDFVFVVQSSLGFYSEMPSSRLVTERDVRRALLLKQKIRLLKGTLVTPAARELGNSHKIFIE
jgi:putative phosphotransacetylase